jgi:hypothetical protein
MPMEEDTVAGTSSDVKTSTARQYSRHTYEVYNDFQAQDTLSQHKLSSKELYLPGQADDYVNWGLGQLFVGFYVETRAG